MIEHLERRKWEIIDLLSRCPQMPAGVVLVRWGPKEPPVELPSGGVVVDVEKFVRTTLHQLENYLEGYPWLGGNWGLMGLLTSLDACGCTVRLEDARRIAQ